MDNLQSPENVDNTQQGQPEQRQQEKPNVENTNTQQGFNILPEEPKKKRIRTTKTNIFIVISVIVLLFAASAAYVFIQNGTIQLNGDPTPPATEETPEEEITEEEPEEEPEVNANGMKEYTSRGYEFTLEYPVKTKLIEPGSYDTDLETYQIIYAGKNQEGEITNKDSIQDGYIVQITFHKKVLNQDLDQIALEKRNKFYIDCPDTANISNISETTISGRTAKTFEVTNCGVDYVMSYLLRGDDLFEFNQIYRGDLGVKQVYKGETDEIVNNFKIINTLQPTPKDKWNTYEGDGYTFKYPAGMDPLCCSLNGPISDVAEKVVVYADPKSIEGTGGNQFNGFGVYRDVRLKDITLEDYVDTQKALLEENYKIIIGRNPVTSEETFEADGAEGVILRGYAWWGDVAIMKNPETKSFVVISKTETSEGGFEEIFKDILTTIRWGK